MIDSKSEEDIQELRRLVPLNALIPQHFKRVVETATLELVEAGADLFREGDEDHYTVYVLEGLVDISTQGQLLETVESDTFPARHALAPAQPRKSTATAKTRARIARVETALLDTLLAWGQSSRDEVGNLNEIAAEDWLARMLQLTLFQKLPPGNLQQAIKRMESVKVGAGDTIIEQGSPGDFFFVIRQGRCEVSRKSRKDAESIKLAELSQGDSFGEEALVSGGRRNATVTMLTPGIVMRLAKNDFIQLIKQPLHIEVDYYKAESLINSSARWLDVRLPMEYQKSHFADSVNLPLPAFRIQLTRLKKDIVYVCYCDTGRRSAIAAYLMREKGIESYVLSGGIMGLPSGVFLTAGKLPTDTDPLSQTLVSPAQIEQAFEDLDESIASDEAIENQRNAPKPKVAPPPARPTPATATPIKEKQNNKSQELNVAASTDMLKEAMQQANKLVNHAKSEAERIRAEADEVWKKAEQNSSRLNAKANQAMAKAKTQVEAAKKKQRLLAAQAVDAVRMNRLREQLTETLEQKKALQQELAELRLTVKAFERHGQNQQSHSTPKRGRWLVVLFLLLLISAGGGALMLMPDQITRFIPAAQKLLPAKANTETVESPSAHSESK